MEQNNIVHRREIPYYYHYYYRCCPPPDHHIECYYYYYSKKDATVVGVAILAVGISGIQQFGGSFWVEPLFNGVTLLIAIGIAGYAQRRKGAAKK